MRSRGRSGLGGLVLRALLPAVLAATADSAWPRFAWPGAWPRDPGEAYAKASVARLKASEMYDASGAVRPLFDPSLYGQPRYREVGAALYVEYGLLRPLTLLGSIPLKEVVQDAEGRLGAAEIHGETFGFGDLRIGARVPLHRGRWAAAVEPDVKVPLGRGSGDAASDPVLGTGRADFGAALSIGAAFPPVQGYAQGSAGYRIRGGETPEETHWDLEIGLEPARPVRVRFRYDGVDSRGRGSESAGMQGMAAPVPSVGEQDFHRVAPTLAVALGRTNELSVTWRRVVDGRSTLRSSEWEIGLSFLGSVVPMPGR